ncbi:hypothetical protein [Magnetofaba australis]|uniref:Putative regulator of plasmid copy number n=1 Tax=Magnetofaba australis IT-1 TaxID=1434232 RepID=A0A1Y2KB05_9PROT|nr:hypothetical protein [Magnetofaba australis]OSM08766.1 putative regulator of plasmid copy number [Magnetofaba australis IT-1]
MDMMIHFPDAVSEKLQNLDDVNLFVVSVVQEALVERRDLEQWQREKIEQAVARADSGRGEFVDHDSVKNWLSSWGTDQETAPPKPMPGR